MKQANIAICGAGIAGIASAYYLAVKYQQSGIVLIDRDLPMSFTTNKSGENYRDYWPDACMSSFIGHSLDLMGELVRQYGDRFDMREFGYDFVSQQAKSDLFSSEHLIDGQLDRITDSASIRSSRPYLADSIQQIVHARHAGAIDVYALGSLLLSCAKKAGVEIRFGEIEDIAYQSDDGFELSLTSAREVDRIKAQQLVLAAGPFVNKLAALLGLELPVKSYLQRKFVIPDPREIIPRDMPFTIFADSQRLNWTDEEQQLFAEDPEYHWLLDEFPPGLHIKPESGSQIKLGWAYNRQSEQPVWTPNTDIEFPSIVMRGASHFIPALEHYVEQLPTPVVQYAGYYTRTKENWPIIGPLDHPNLYAVAALSGYGTMAACAAGELCANWMMNEPLPDYADNFHPNRYHDPAVKAQLALVDSDGQL